MDCDENKNRAVTLVPLTGHLAIKGSVPTIAAGTCIASAWYKDAFEQSKQLGRDALRREIIFVACFLESYIYEWAQSELVGDIDYLLAQIPMYKKNGKPKRIPSLLLKWETFPRIVSSKQGRVAPMLDLNDLKTLINYRDGLVHGKVSRMYIANERNLSFPEPSLHEIDMRPNGWALKIAVDLIKGLHSQFGTSTPNYLA